MSAVMSTLSMISGTRRAHRKLACSSRKSGQFSDVGEDRSRSQHDLNKQQRSASLQTLEAGGVANLESLEAKMASIEVSLAGSRRRSAGARDVTRELDALRTALTDKDSLIQSLKKQLSASLSAARLAAQAASPTASRASSQEDASPVLSADERRALEERANAVRTDLDTRKANIQELRRRLEKTHVTDNIDTRIQQAELQYKLGREELELLTLSEQARALAQLIEQADAAASRNHRATIYSAVRESGGCGSLVSAEVREGSWGASPRGNGMIVEWPGDNTTIKPGDRLIEVNGTSVIACRSQEELQRATSTNHPARIVLLRSNNTRVEAPPQHNGFTQNEAASLRAELGSLRAAAEDAEKAKESLRSDNTRLTHRISYLEEQVAELLSRHTTLHSVSSNDSCITVNKTKKNVTNINITTEPQNKPSPKSEVQVFQKGPDITAIVAKLPGLDGAESNLPLIRPRSNASGASSRAAISPRASPPLNHRSHSSHSLEHKAERMRHSLSHHCIHGGIDYSAETDAAIRMIERNQRHIEKQRMKNERLSRSKCEDYFRSDSDLDMRDTHSNVSADPRHYEIKKAADRIEESIKKTNWAERKTLSIIEQLKRSQRLRKMKKNDSTEDIQLDSERHYMYHRIDGKVLENAHKSSRRSSKLHSRSAKSSEFESESDFPNGDMYSSSPRIDYGSETCSRVSHYKKNDDRKENDVKSRPTPPRKPLRLSLHKARSAHSLINGSESETPSRPVSEAKVTDSESCTKRPVKRTHAGDKWARERIRDAGRATPRPTRKLLNGLSACEAPAADDLYPENTHMPVRVNGVAGKWC
ncbi:PDZ domain-containing protein sprite [Anticarsia gemmatalis]|uniref:PDZ domain-containing protein sprite n=1 Tax=Anticarsia gemmatalis TaxID=129554 RepID=UPI003F758124